MIVSPLVNRPRATDLRLGHGSRGALLLHGFTGAPGELRSIAESLAETGWQVCAPLLPGHGTTMSDLNNTKASDWLDKANSEFDILRRATGKPVAIVGFSMGGLLALELAGSRTHEVGPVALMSSPLYFTTFMGRFVLPFLVRSGLARLITSLPKTPAALPEETARERFVYDGWPVRACGEFARVMRQARRSLSSIESPLLGLYGANDTTAPPANLSIIESECTASLDKHIFENSGHVLPLDIERDSVRQKVLEFLTRHG